MRVAMGIVRNEPRTSSGEESLKSYIWRSLKLPGKQATCRVAEVVSRYEGPAASKYTRQPSADGV